MKNLVVILALFLLIIPSIKSLLVKGSYTSHDLTHHIIRQKDMDKLLSEGQFPPRWSADLNQGYGYPLFLFNYPLPPLVGEIFVKLGFGFIESVKLVMIFSMIMSTVGMYLFLNELLRSKSAAFTGAIFYLYAPVRFITIYVSAAVGTALALGIVPFVFLAFTSLSRKKSLGFVLLGALSLFGLITSHNVTTLMFLPFLLVYCLLFIASAKDKKILIKYYTTTFILGFGLAAFFWLPALVEKQFTRYDLILPRFWADHFPTMAQLIRSPWGYGMSHAGTADDAMSFQIGIIHIAVIVLLIPLIWLLRRKRELLHFGIFALLGFFLSVFLMLAVSTFFWDKLPMLGYVQFPFRFLAVAAFFASMGVGLLVKHLPGKPFPLILLTILVLFANRNHLNVNERLSLADRDYALMDTTSTMLGEHLPPWADLANKVSPGKFEIIEGDGTLEILENKSVKVVANILARSDVKIRLNQFYFPGWKIDVNGRAWEFDFLQKGESYGLPVFNLKPGKNVVTAEFGDTPIRTLGNSISFLSFLIIFGILIKILLTRYNFSLPWIKSN